jgi:hypothetical protein
MGSGSPLRHPSMKFSLGLVPTEERVLVESAPTLLTCHRPMDRLDQKLFSLRYILSLQHFDNICLRPGTDQAVILQICCDYRYSFFNTRLLAVDVDLGVFWRLIGRTDARELLDLAGFGLFVQSLRVSLFRFLNWDVDKYLDEGQGRVRVLRVRMQLSGGLSVGLVGRDKGR